MMKPGNQRVKFQQQGEIIVEYAGKEEVKISEIRVIRVSIN